MVSCLVVSTLVDSGIVIVVDGGAVIVVSAGVCPCWFSLDFCLAQNTNEVNTKIEIIKYFILPSRKCGYFD